MIAYNQTAGVLLPCAKVLTILPAVFGGYALIRLEGFTAVFCAVYALDMTCLLELVLSLLAEQGIRSREFLYCLKKGLKGRRGSALRRELAALRPITVTVGNGSYSVDKQLVLTVLEIIATYTVNAILL